MDRFLLRFYDLSVRYGDKSVFTRVSAELGPGNVALVGANGVGKSTLLAILAGALRPDNGQIMIDGIDLARGPVKAKRKLAYVPDKNLAYPFLTGREFLNFVSKAKGCSSDEYEHLIPEFELLPYLDKRFHEMSLGTQRKHFLIAACIGDPLVMLMDEPTNGLDKKTQELLMRLLLKRREDRLVLIATHDLTFSEQIGAKKLLMSAHGLSLAAQ